MKAWDDLVGAALLGVQRRPPDLAALPPGVRDAAAAREDQAERLLVAAALLTGYRRAGRLPVADVRPVPAAPPDPRPVVPVAARERLARLLTTGRPELLEEWLCAVARAGLRVPPERLPALADAARGRVSLRSPLAAAAGPAAGWLGEHRPEWAFLSSPVPDGDADAWRYGSLVQRKHWLARALVEDPDGARAALAGSWRGEPADIRAAFLGLLGEHLRPEDEDFLERALDDRAASVRRSAAELLAHLPGSAFARRMADRLRPLVRVRRSAFGADVLEFAAPDLADPELPRDGVLVARGPDPHDAVLERFVAATPLAFWADFGPPSAVAGMPCKGFSRIPLDNAWATAAARQRDAGWARALLVAHPHSGHSGDLVGVLEPAEQAAAIADLARRFDAKAVTAVVAGLPAPWSVELGTALLDWIAVQEDKRHVAHAAADIALAAPPGCLGHPLATTPPPENAATWRRSLFETLAFRREMHEELS